MVQEAYEALRHLIELIRDVLYFTQTSVKHKVARVKK